MMVKNGITIENINLIHEKAKTKKDGVYSFRGMLYLVQKNRFTYLSCYQEILFRSGNFNVHIGYSNNPRKELMTILETSKESTNGK
jgi:hypothetical protein